MAKDRYLAEDALDDIRVEYRKLPAVIDPLARWRRTRRWYIPRSARMCRRTAISTMAIRTRNLPRPTEWSSLTIDYPRNSQTPLEGYVVVADYQPGEGVYDVLCNFQGPFTVHPVMSKALRCQGAQLRMRTPAYFGRRIRRQTGDLPLRRVDVHRIQAHRPAGQMGGGSFRASHCGDRRAEPASSARKPR